MTSAEAGDPAFAWVAEGTVDLLQVDTLKAFIEECPYPPAPPDVLTEEYWVSAEDAQSQPQNPVEELVGQLLQRSDLRDIMGKDVAGANWSWHDYLDTDDPKVYHTDCNRRLVNSETVETNPQWSSVVYLTDEGGSTAIWRGSEFVANFARCGCAAVPWPVLGVQGGPCARGVTCA